LHTRPEDDRFRDLALSIEYTPNDIQWFIKAFDCQKIHKKSDGNYRDNYGHSAMATVGDAVLRLIIAEYFFDRFEDKGMITEKKARLESDNTISRVARVCGFERYYYDGSGTHQDNYLPCGDKALSNQFEAVVFAIYKDLGFEAVKEWAYKWFIPIADRLSKQEFIRVN